MLVLQDYLQTYTYVIQITPSFCDFPSMYSYLLYFKGHFRMKTGETVRLYNGIASKVLSFIYGENIQKLYLEVKKLHNEEVSQRIILSCLAQCWSNFYFDKKTRMKHMFV